MPDPHIHINQPAFRHSVNLSDVHPSHRIGFDAPTKRRFSDAAASHIAHELPNEVTTVTAGCLRWVLLRSCSAWGVPFETTPSALNGANRRRGGGGTC